MSYTMMGVLAILAAISFCEIVVTKKTPFYWAAVLLIYIEAGIRQAVRSLGAMLSHYVQHYAASVAEVKAQLLKRQSLVVLGINDKRARG
jgi:hypothetical protein